MKGSRPSPARSRGRAKSFGFEAYSLSGKHQAYSPDPSIRRFQDILLRTVLRRQVSDGNARRMCVRIERPLFQWNSRSPVDTHRFQHVFNTSKVVSKELGSMVICHSRRVSDREPVTSYK